MSKDRPKKKIPELTSPITPSSHYYCDTKDEMLMEYPNYNGPGWYRVGNNFALVLEVDRGSRFIIQVWDNIDPREEMRRVINLQYRG